MKRQRKRKEKQRDEHLIPVSLRNRRELFFLLCREQTKHHTAQQRPLSDRTKASLHKLDCAMSLNRSKKTQKTPKCVEHSAFQCNRHRKRGQSQKLNNTLDAYLKTLVPNQEQHERFNGTESKSNNADNTRSNRYNVTEIEQNTAYPRTSREATLFREERVEIHVLFRIVPEEKK